MVFTDKGNGRSLRFALWQHPIRLAQRQVAHEPRIFALAPCNNIGFFSKRRKQWHQRIFFTLHTKVSNLQCQFHERRGRIKEKSELHVSANIIKHINNAEDGLKLFVAKKARFASWKGRSIGNFTVFMLRYWSREQEMPFDRWVLSLPKKGWYFRQMSSKFRAYSWEYPLKTMF